MSDVSTFKIDNTSITIKDATARTNASNAVTLATTASGNATTALNKVAELEKLGRVEVAYTSTNETITITTKTHDVG